MWGFYIRRRQRLVYTLGWISLFTLMVFFFSRVVNYSGILDRKNLLVIDLNRDKIPSRWNFGSWENFTSPLSSSLNLPLPIAFYNDTDILWSRSKAETAKNLTQLLKHIRQINEAQVIRNRLRFGDEPPLFIIIVQVHNRSTHLMYLIESLRKVRYIEKALVIFSHDLFSPEINRMLEAVRFVRFTQIFFPYSQQLFLNSYPGSQPNDCHERGEHNCLTQEWPDIAGNFRNPNFTQVKHHWIWKLTFVMNKMNVSQSFSGWYILLEEDYVVLPDMLHVLGLTEQHNASFDIVALGSYEASQSFNSPDYVYISTWASPKHNMGMAFKRSLYDRVNPCFKKFCLYDDYNWDWSFSFIDRTCLNPRLRVLHFKNCGRVFHTGSCGLHSKSIECDDVEASIRKVMDQTSSRLTQNLFPKSLAVSSFPLRSIPKPNGGWNDPRDLGLCLAIIDNRWKPLTELLPTDTVKLRRLDIFEPLIPAISDSESSVL